MPPLSSKLSALLVLALATLSGCASPTSSSASSSSGGASSSSGGADSLACTDFGGTCVKGSTANPKPTCATGSVRTLQGGCTGFDVCCLPAKAAGSQDRRGDTGLLCTADDFAEFAPGSCDNGKGARISCGVGCACSPGASGPACDCSRGLPPTKAGQVECAVFACGGITCGIGCSCVASEGGGACRCP